MSNSANDDATNKTNYNSSSEEYKGEDEKGLVPTKAKEIGQSIKEKVKSVGTKTEEKAKALVVYNSRSYRAEVDENGLGLRKHWEWK